MSISKNKNTPPKNTTVLKRKITEILYFFFYCHVFGYIEERITRINQNNIGAAIVPITAITCYLLGMLHSHSIYNSNMQRLNVILWFC